VPPVGDVLEQRLHGDVLLALERLGVGQLALGDADAVDD
jgi:hypothetical protein